MIKLVVIENSATFVNVNSKKKIFQCPSCGNFNHFYTAGKSHCRVCHKALPNVYAIMINEVYRFKWHKGLHQ